jgi:hypothetical protein
MLAALCGLAPSSAPGPASAADAPTKWELQRREQFKNSAPADRYFGRLKMSFLGINNTLRFEALRAGDHSTDSSIVNKVNYADDSLQAWAAEYPRDPQLARSYYLAVLVYKKIWTKPAQEKAWSYMQLILSKYPESYFAKQVRNDIAAGFTEHYYADPLPCPTPPPTPTPLPSPTPIPTPSPRGRGPSRPTPSLPPTPEPSAIPSPTPVPSPTPSPSPYWRGGVRQPAIEILTPPCSPLAFRPAKPAPLRRLAGERRRVDPVSR